MASFLSRLPQGKVVAALIVLLLVVDQVIKIWVKTTMVLGQSHVVAPWFQIHFVENPGMAFGIELGSKLFLSLFRIVAMGFCIYLLAKLVRKREHTLAFLSCLSLIIAGGIGNIIDSIFYGVIFSGSHGEIAQLFPSGGGYETWFHGRVVDMFYFPLIEGVFPSWLPFWGGEEFVFFHPVFNFADSCISIGLILLLVCYPRTVSLLLDGKKTLPEGTTEDSEPTKRE